MIMCYSFFFFVIPYNVNKLQELAQKMEGQTEQLAGDVASLRETP